MTIMARFQAELQVQFSLFLCSIVPGVHKDQRTNKNV